MICWEGSTTEGIAWDLSANSPLHNTSWVPNHVFKILVFKSLFLYWRWLLAWF